MILKHDLWILFLGIVMGFLAFALWTSVRSSDNSQNNQGPPATFQIVAVTLGNEPFVVVIDTRTSCMRIKRACFCDGTRIFSPNDTRKF